MRAGVAGLRIGLDHALDDPPFQQHESATAIDGRGETSLARAFGPGAERADIKQGRGLKALGPAGGAPDRGMAPVDHFQGIDAGDEILIEAQHVKYLLRRETDVGVDEQQVRRLRRLQELADEGVAAAGDQRIMAEQGERRVEARLPRELHQTENRLHVMLRDEAPETGRRDEHHRSLRGLRHAHLPVAPKVLAARAATAATASPAPSLTRRTMREAVRVSIGLKRARAIAR